MRNFVRSIAVTSACVASATPLAGQSLSDMMKLNLCRALQDDAMRLKCYDAVASPPPPAKTTERIGSEILDEAHPTWAIKDSKSPLDDAPQVSGILVASEGSGSLMVRCQENRTEVAVAPTAAFLGSRENIKVIYRIDNNKPVQAAWQPSQNGQAVFASGAIPLLKSLTEGGTLFVRVFGYGGRTYDSTFRLGQVSTLRDKIAETCQWPK